MSGPRRQRIGVFGGAFDPPHRGHVAIARAAIDQLQLDVLHLLPTGEAWHKARDLTAAVHRIAMCELAFSGMDALRLDLRETRRAGPTYTIDTLLELQQEYVGAAFYLVMGADQAQALSAWHRAEEIFRIAIICVVARPGVQESLDSMPSPAPDVGRLGAEARVQFLQLPPTPLSATDVRQRALLQESVDTLVSPSVARYIEQHHLYQTA